MTDAQIRALFIQAHDGPREPAETIGGDEPYGIAWMPFTGGRHRIAVIGSVRIVRVIHALPDNPTEWGAWIVWERSA